MKFLEKVIYVEVLIMLMVTWVVPMSYGHRADTLGTKHAIGIPKSHGDGTGPLKNHGIGSLKSHGHGTGPLKNHDETGPLKSHGDGTSPIKSHGDKTDPLKNHGGGTGPIHSHGGGTGPIKSHGGTGPLKNHGGGTGPLHNHGGGTGTIKSHGGTGPLKNHGGGTGPLHNHGGGTVLLKNHGDRTGHLKNHGGTGPIKNHGGGTGPLHSHVGGTGPLKNHGDRTSHLKSHGGTGPLKSHGDATGPLKSHGDATGPLKSHINATGPLKNSGDGTNTTEIGWHDARATFYGDINGGETQQGACGYGDLHKQGYGLETAALSTALFNNGSTCGACYEIKCVNTPQWCLPGTIKITATNFCPPDYSKDRDCWCNPPQEHFDLSQPMFLKIAKYKAGVVPVRYRRVPCAKTGNVKFEIKGNPHFLMVLPYNVGGAGDIKAMEIKGTKTEWLAMSKNWGQIWTSGTVMTGQCLSFRITTSDGVTKDFIDVTPPTWDCTGQSFDGKINF